MRQFTLRTVFTCLFLLGAAITSGTKAPIEPDLQTALAKSRATGRPVIANFHALY